MHCPYIYTQTYTCINIFMCVYIICMCAFWPVMSLLFSSCSPQGCHTLPSSGLPQSSPRRAPQRSQSPRGCGSRPSRGRRRRRRSCRSTSRRSRGSTPAASMRTRTMGTWRCAFLGRFANGLNGLRTGWGSQLLKNYPGGGGGLYHCPHIDWTPGRLKCLPTEASPELRVIAAERRSVPFRTQRQPPSRLFCLQSPFWPIGGPALRSISSPQPEGALPPHLPASPDARPRQSARLDFSPLDDLELSPASSPDGKGPMLEDEKQLGRGRGG